MRLKVLLPTEILVDVEVSKVIAEAANGSFCLQPRHIDFVSHLVPGLLSFITTEGKEAFVAVAEGTLVKCAAEVLVSTRNAVLGTELSQLREIIISQSEELEEREQVARSALARLEAGVVRRFIELEKSL